MEVAALYRYPLKGFTPEACETMTVEAGGGIAGDRVLGIRFADDPAPDDAWSRKTGMLVLMNTPGLARLQVRYDAGARRLRVALDDSTLVDESIDGAGRQRIASAIEAFALTLEETPLRTDTRHLPLRLVGDGVVSRFTDSEAQGVSLHGRASLRALAQALADPDLSELRFRSNIAIEGTDPWEEVTWEGQAIRIGELVFDVSRPKTRCLATQANPATGERDRAVLTTLTHSFEQELPTFAIGLRPRHAGVLRLGDRIEVMNARLTGQ